MFPFVISSFLRVLSLKRICPVCKKGQTVPSGQKRKPVKCKFCNATMPAPSTKWHPRTSNFVPVRHLPFRSCRIETQEIQKIISINRKPVFSCYQKRAITPETRFPETDFGFSFSMVFLPNLCYGCRGLPYRKVLFMCPIQKYTNDISWDQTGQS